MACFLHVCSCLHPRNSHHEDVRGCAAGSAPPVLLNRVKKGGAYSGFRCVPLRALSSSLLDSACAAPLAAPNGHANTTGSELVLSLESSSCNSGSAKLHDIALQPAPSHLFEKPTANSPESKGRKENKATAMKICAIRYQTRWRPWI